MFVFTCSHRILQTKGAQKKRKKKEAGENHDTLTSARLRVIQEAAGAASRRAHAVLQLS